MGEIKLNENKLATYTVCDTCDLKGEETHSLFHVESERKIHEEFANERLGRRHPIYLVNMGLS